MAGEENNTQPSADPFALLAQLLAAGGAGATANGVYLGVQKAPAARGTIRGQRVDTGKTTTDKVVSTQEANKLYLNDPKLQAAWRKTMQRNGLETGNPVTERKAWEVAVAGASDWYSTSGGTAKITPEQYLTWWAGGQKKKGPAVPTRQIYDVPEADIKADIDTIAQKTLGRTINEADKAEDWYKNLVKGISDMYARGTVTSVKEVVNPKTGKKEKQVIQSPKFSKEKIATTIEDTLAGASPVDVERKQRVDFTQWLFSQMGGQG